MQKLLNSGIQELSVALYLLFKSSNHSTDDADDNSYDRDR